MRCFCIAQGASGGKRIAARFETPDFKIPRFDARADWLHRGRGVSLQWNNAEKQEEEEKRNREGKKAPGAASPLGCSDFS